MKEISLNILDIAQNSVKAGATRIEISLTQLETVLQIVIKDDGCGMSPEILKQVENPFYTTRTTRSVGLGIPLYKAAAEQAGGGISIQSVQQGENAVAHGTTITAVFHTDHIDCMPLGDMVATLCTLIQGAPAIDILYQHQTNCGSVKLDTKEIRSVLGEDIPTDCFEVINWIREYLEEQYQALEIQYNK